MSGLNIIRMDKLLEAKEYLHQKKCTICGVEIMENAKDITSHPFR